MGHAVSGCGCIQTGRGGAPCSFRGDLSDRSAPVRYGHALALLLGVRRLYDPAAGRVLEYRCWLSSPAGYGLQAIFFNLYAYLIASKHNIIVFTNS